MCVVCVGVGGVACLFACVLQVAMQTYSVEVELFLELHEELINTIN